MAIITTHGDTQFGVGDMVQVTQTVNEEGKKRNYIFQGMVISIRGRGENKSFVVRRVGEAQVGIERIFPLSSPLINSVKVVKSGGKGIRRTKLYYTRNKSRREVDLINTRENKRQVKATKQ